MNRMTQGTIRKLALMAMLVAIYVVLSFYGTIRIGNSLKLTVDALPIVLGALIFGPIEGMTIGLMGSFINQMLTYGLTVTTILWMLPCALRGLIVGFYALKHGGINIKPANLSFVLVLSSLVVSICNTFTLYLDSKIYGYYSFALVFVPIPLRILHGLITAAIFVVVTFPLIRCIKAAMPDLAYVQHHKEI